MSLIQPNKSMFMRAEHTPPSAWMGHIPFAGWLTEATQPTIFVELGTHCGTSYLAFCQAVVANGLATRCFAVDTWEGDEHAGLYDESIYGQLHGYHATKYGAFSRLMRMTFDDAVNYFDDGSIDLLHIDGLHTYDAVRHDFETWLPKLSHRGVIIFHDTCVREREFGVWRFWAEISARYPSFEFTHSHGLGVLAVGDDIPLPLRALLGAAGDESRLLVNQMFESLGRTLDANFEIERLNRALAHEQALRREDRAVALADVGEILREQVDCIRGDIVHSENLILSGQSELKRSSDTDELLRKEIVVGVDALRHDIVAVRDYLVAAATEVDEQGRLALESRLNALKSAQVARDESLHGQLTAGTDALRHDLVAIRNDLLQAGESSRSELSSRIDVLLEDSLRLDSLAKSVERLDDGIVDLRNRGVMIRLRRLIGGDPAPLAGK